MRIDRHHRSLAARTMFDSAIAKAIVGIVFAIACASTASVHAQSKPSPGPGSIPTRTPTSTPAPASASVPTSPPALVRLLVKTTLGDILIDVDGARAPVTAANFLRYVDAKQFDGGRFHRTVKIANQPGSPVKIEVIQAGVRPELAKSGFPAIAIERTSVTGVRHTDGAISMARAAPDSATSDWFICIGDQPELDFGGTRNPDGQGFAAFGHVVRGMDVVRKIQQAPNAEGQKLTPPVEIVSITRVGS